MPPHGIPSYTAGDFSAAINRNPTLTYQGDCKIEVGVVVDTRPYPDYRRIAGVRMNCSTKRQYIQVRVYMEVKYNGVWSYQPADVNTVTHYNTYGSGDFIIKSVGMCAPVRGQAYTWRAVAEIYTDRFTVIRIGGLSSDTTGC